MYTILVAEAEAEIRDYLRLALKLQGLKVQFADSGNEILPLISDEKQQFSLILLDGFMSVRDGCGSLKAIRQLRPDLPVVIMSASATPSNVIAAMTQGAKDFLAKPIGHEELKTAIERALNVTLPLASAARTAAPGEGEEPFSVSGSWSKKIALLLERVASSDVPVLLQGETGVGKEVLARKLHARSRRADRPFLKLNCAALPSELVESELFGYEKGAFTGAFKSTPGKFEMANGGTIFLDEIGDMDVKLQAKLLQVLQDREFHRLGAKETSRVDVRVMAASHCDFDKAIQEGRFREDLFYRLNIIDIHIPPLRERLDELFSLAELFIGKHATSECPALTLSASLKQSLLEHPWPGNIRELENTMQKLLVLRNPDILADDLRQRQRKGRRPVASQDNLATEQGSLPATTANVTPQVEDASRTGIPSQDLNVSFRENSPRSAEAKVPIIHFATVMASTTNSDSVLSSVQNAHRNAETEAIMAALNSTLWNRKQAAALLHIDYKALLYKMKKLGIGEKLAVAAAG